MRSTRASSVEVTLSESTAVIRRSGQSTPVIAGILGVEKNAAGVVKTVWLDRLVHGIGEDRFDGWAVSGAVSTILRRVPETRGVAESTDVIV